MTALKHERFAPDSYNMLRAEQHHKWSSTAADSKINTCCPFLLPTVMMDSGFAHCSFGFAGCFRLRHCVQTSRISTTGNPICSQVTGNTYSS